MTAQITVTRTPGEIPHEITLEPDEIEEAKKAIESKCENHSYCLKTANGDWFCPECGLTDPDSDRRKFKAQYERAEACGLDHLFPLAGLSPHEENGK